MPKVAVVQFPGSNCEYETVKAACHYGLDASILAWNVEFSVFDAFDAYFLPGGFSFQDRVRAGVLASKLPVVSWIAEKAKKGIPVLGICNGCQILSEAGLVPDLSGEQSIQVALAPNSKETRPFGFICDWVFVRIRHPKACVFTTQFEEHDVLPIPVNHGEGHFILESELQLSALTRLTYCRADGSEDDLYPTNPNGSSQNIAGLSNAAGNVLALMPHPERASFLYQIPAWIDSDWAMRKRHQFKVGQWQDTGPWEKLFLSLRDG